MNSFVYRSQEPYPLVEAGEKNPAYAREMLSNIGGGNSEMSAVASYFYDSLVTSENYDVSTIFHHISMAEMHHLQIFGELAMQLGADPRLWSKGRGGPVYWSPKYVKYSRNMGELLKNALNDELAAIEKYKKQCNNIKNQNVVENLERIIMDEEVHVEIFRQLISQNEAGRI